MESFSFNLLLLGLFLLAVNLPGIFTDLSKNGNKWVEQAEFDLLAVRNEKKNERVAKNIIIFIGDAMSLSTIAATRILKGQVNKNVIEPLVFESFPTVGLSKTYSIDRQVSDSASTATAYFCGVKTNFGVLGFDGKTKLSVCSTTEEQRRSSVDSILKIAHDAGKVTGVVSNMRITHASPAASYAHTADREWESDYDMPNGTENCKDIAQQLIDDNDYINVLMGGGRQKFLPVDVKDPKTGKADSKNGRRDGRDLIEEWKKDKELKKAKYSYVYTKKQLEEVDSKKTDYLLGLFSSSHMAYELERNSSPSGEPSLAEMTAKAIDILKTNSNGFFLFVEGGLIDSGHHDNLAKKALYETLALDEAVQKALDLINIEDTLVVVTSDHSASFSIVGYPTMDNPIFAAVDKTEWGGTSDNLPYTTLLYTSGPGFKMSSDGKRENITNIDTESKDYLQQAGIPMYYGTHSGEDVAIYGIGPWSHLYQGVHEQSYIPHVMAYAACMSPLGKSSPHCEYFTNGSGQMKTLFDYFPVLGLFYIYVGLRRFA